MIDAPSSTFPVATITLSREELLVIMRFLNAPEILGFDLSWLEITEDGKLSTAAVDALNAATLRLKERGYLVLPEGSAEGRLQLTAPIRAILGACAFHEVCLLLSLSERDDLYNVYFYVFRDIFVIHTVVTDDLHRFTVLNDVKSTLRYMDDFMGVRDQHTLPEIFPPARIQEDLAAEARGAAHSGDLAACHAFLVQGGLSPDAAHVFSQTMAHAVRTCMLALMISDQQGVPQPFKEIGIVVAPDLCISLETDARDPAWMQVQSLSLDAIHAWMSSSIASALKYKREGGLV